MTSYTVQAGDTLASIARRFLGNALRYTELAAFNGITNPNFIQVGQVIRIPSRDELDFVTVQSQRLPEVAIANSGTPLPVFAMEAIEVSASRDWIILAGVAGLLYYSLGKKQY